MQDNFFEKENPPVMEAEIKKLEKAFGFRFPADMKQFYCKHNGGRLKDCRFGTNECELSCFHPIGGKVKKPITMNKLLEWQEMNDIIPMHFIPFCSDIADDFYYVRVDKDGYGKIYYFISDHYEEFLENPDGEGFAAESFTKFLEQIRAVEEA